MGRRRDPTTRSVKKLTERERTVGLEDDDEAARWLAEHDPKPPPVTPKSVHKSKLLHRWRRQNS